MNQERLIAAFGRLDRALLRVEVAAERPPVGSGADAELLSRHERLREAAGATLAELDRLLEAR